MHSSLLGEIFLSGPFEAERTKNEGPTENTTEQVGEEEEAGPREEVQAYLCTWSVTQEKLNWRTKYRNRNDEVKWERDDI